MNYHKSVLLEQAVLGLNVLPRHRYIDATMGGGGHSKRVIDLGGIVLGIDSDRDSIDFVKQSLADEIKEGKLIPVKGNFAEIDRIGADNGFNKVSGILFDLGVSSHQIDTPGRGFSYLKSGPLDMRMDQNLGIRAADLINGLGKNELIELFTNYAEEPRARKIAENIISARGDEPITTTEELVDILARSYGFNNVTDFAKAKSSARVFQALRIAVNDELESLKTAIPKSLDLLDKGGRMSVITFHSLEDRIVKRAFAGFESGGLAKAITDKPTIPSREEIKINPRSRGAKLRILEKL